MSVSLIPAVRLSSIPPPSGEAPELRSRFGEHGITSSDIDEREHLENVVRLRRLLIVGIALWFFAGSIIDWNVCRIRVDASHLEHIVVRVASTCVFLVILARLYAKQAPSKRAFATLELITFVTAGAATGYFSMRNGGTSSPSMHFIMPILVTQGISIPRPWKQGLIFSSATFASGPLSLLGLSLFFPKLRAQIETPEELSRFAIEFIMLATAATLVVLGAHFVWTLRREVFSARQVGRYQLKERIASGGMGEIWLGHHSALKREVAIKLLRGSSGRSAPAVERFNREVDALAGLSHPNTVRVYDRGVTEEGLSFFVMEYVKGETVALLVERIGALPSERALRILLQAAKALAEAHSKSIVHRDITPQNILVTQLGGETDFVKVIDFGIAKILEDGVEGAQQTSFPNAPMGSPAYMSPERLVGGTGDARSDVYALGAVLYFMITGKKPRSANSTTAAMHESLAKIRVPSSSEISEVMEALVLKCLAADPEERFADAAQLVKAIARTQSTDPKFGD